ncbi:hypothetical protein BSZ21_34675 [Bradyrhizobium canariense]|nr:hypothetical protein BSZ21_34675 [Bradyrhizobium canariense]
MRLQLSIGGRRVYQDALTSAEYKAGLFLRLRKLGSTWWAQKVRMAALVAQLRMFMAFARLAREWTMP